MAKLIAREDFALSVGGGSCSAYQANRGVTKAKAESFGCRIRITYSDNQLVAKQDLQHFTNTYYGCGNCDCHTGHSVCSTVGCYGQTADPCSKNGCGYCDCKAGFSNGCSAKCYSQKQISCSTNGCGQCEPNQHLCNGDRNDNDVFQCMADCYSQRNIACGTNNCGNCTSAYGATPCSSHGCYGQSTKACSTYNCGNCSCYSGYGACSTVGCYLDGTCNCVGTNCDKDCPSDNS